MDYKKYSKEEYPEDFEDKNFVTVSRSPEDDECLMVQKYRDNEPVDDPIGGDGEFYEGNLHNPLYEQIKDEQVVYVEEEAQTLFDNQIGTSQINYECNGNYDEMAKAFDEKLQNAGSEEKSDYDDEYDDNDADGYYDGEEYADA